MDKNVGIWIYKTKDSNNFTKEKIQRLLGEIPDHVPLSLFTPMEDEESRTYFEGNYYIFGFHSSSIQITENELTTISSICESIMDGIDNINCELKNNIRLHILTT